MVTNVRHITIQYIFVNTQVHLSLFTHIKRQIQRVSAALRIPSMCSAEPSEDCLNFCQKSIFPSSSFLIVVMVYLLGIAISNIIL